MKKLTQERLKELLHYNPLTGIFTNKTTRSSNSLKGAVSGYIDDNGYVHIGVNNKLYKAHRLAWLYVEGYFPEQLIDHENRIKSDNRWTNLRVASYQCNSRNSSIAKNNKSGITGVCWHKATSKWRADIAVEYKCVPLGIFESKIKAAKARWKAEKKYNFPNCNSTSSALLYIKKYYGVNQKEKAKNDSYLPK